MTLNCVEIDQVLKDMDLVGAFVQGIRQLSYKLILFDTYRSGKALTVLVDLDGRTARIHPYTQNHKPMKPHPRFCEFLRSRVKGYRITRAQQWQQDRIVELRLESEDDALTLWIRLWGSQANILACNDQNIIVDAAYRRPKSGEVSGATWHPSLDHRLNRPSSTPKSYQLQILPPQFEGPTWSHRLEKALTQGSEQAIEDLRERVRSKVQGELYTQEMRIETLTQQLEQAREHEEWKFRGDLILAWAHEIRKGEVSWTGTDYRNDHEITLELDPLLTPQENAAVFYRRQAKLRDNQERLARENLEAQNQLKHLTLLLTKVEGAEAVAALEKILSEVGGVSTLLSGPVKKSKNPLPGIQVKSGEFQLLVGRNAKENDELLRRGVRGNDTWIHVRGGSGGYAFIRSLAGKTIPLSTLLDGCQLALWYSKLRQAAQADLYVTQVKYLRRAKNGPLGLVIPTQEKNYTIQLDEARVRTLLGGDPEE